jgi:hypothetical protein
MKKLRIGLVLVIILAIFVTVFPTDSFAYVSVKGYFRSDGTYVSPYVRSNPNAFKFDNYSWTPSQGLYNPSYYVPIKNYSSNWYIPSYITDPDYYLGKSLYESGQSEFVIIKPVIPSLLPSYSGTVSGGAGINAPIIPTTLTKPAITCGANQYRSGTYCYCNDGYKKNYSTNQCELK